MVDAVCVNLSGLVVERLLRATMGIRAHLPSLVPRPQGPFWGPGFRRAGETVLPFLLRHLADSAGRCGCYVVQHIMWGAPGSPPDNWHLKGRPRRCARACSLGRWRGRCGADERQRPSTSERSHIVPSYGVELGSSVRIGQRVCAGTRLLQRSSKDELARVLRTDHFSIRCEFS
jgi:hypothetical protein